MLKNPKKADLDKDGKLSGYEKKRGMAIEKAMAGKKPMKAVLGAMALGAAGALGAKKLFKKKKATATPGKEPIRKGIMGNLVEEKKKELMGKKMGGKVMKAKRGKFNDLQKFAKGKGLPAPLAGAAGSGFGKMAGNFPAIKTAPGSMASKAEAVSKMKSAKELTKEAGKKFLKKRMGVGAALATGVLAAGKAAKAFKDKKAAQKRDTAKVKKMGGGMMQRPMGMGMAKKGKMIKARGGGMARTKPTSMY